MAMKKVFYTAEILLIQSQRLTWFSYHDLPPMLFSPNIFKLEISNGGFFSYSVIVVILGEKTA